MPTPRKFVAAHKSSDRFSAVQFSRTEHGKEISVSLSENDCYKICSFLDTCNSRYDKTIFVARDDAAAREIEQFYLQHLRGLVLFHSGFSIKMEWTNLVELSSKSGGFSVPNISLEPDEAVRLIVNTAQKILAGHPELCPETKPYRPPPGIRVLERDMPSGKKNTGLKRPPWFERD